MRRTILVVGFLALAACGESATLPIGEGTGSDPKLPPPAKTLLPTVNVAKAVGWKSGETPKAAAGYQVSLFAEGLDHPRWLYRLPNGDVLVAETNGPAKSTDDKGIMGWIAKQVLERAGAGVPSPDRISLLRDADGDGVAETKAAFLTGLVSPFGMALVGRDFYVANTDAVVRYLYDPGATSITGAGARLATLPAGKRNHHWTKSLVVSADGNRLYVGVGSNSNVGENGIDEEENRASIHEIDRLTGDARVFASGLRNPVGLDWNPVTGELWVAVNERDELGSDLVPDYMTSVRDGGFYGWPYSYYGSHVDARVKPQRPDLVAKAIRPDYALGPHTASLGLAFAVDGSGVYIGQHGSWNRKPRSGYKVIFVPFAGGRPAGPPKDILTGFLVGDVAKGRPVGVTFAADGALLVADDVGNRVWRVAGPGLEMPAKAAIAPE